MSQAPEGLKFARSHEWVRLEDDGSIVIGISEHAQEALGDVVFVELPEAGSDLVAGDEVAVVESLKAASDIYAPVSGTVLAVNEALSDAPETINSSPYAEGWFFRLRPSDTAELDELMDGDAYQEHLSDAE
ncbi:MAG: glycine cleavage system protein GcvH [Chromatocurvus sp.]